MPANNINSSFRDPSGFVFSRDNTIWRQVNFCYRENYDLLMRSGLFKKLVSTGALIGHDEEDTSDGSGECYKILKPTQIPFISYPYEWCFGQLKDAALLTLKIQKEALNYGLSLKDASSFNVQFQNGRPIFIDTLSFEKYEEGRPWVAYKQFCEHFLAPLALVAYTDERLGKYTETSIDGVPLDLAAKILPFSAKMKPSILLHIVLHSRNQKRFSDREIQNDKKINLSKNSLLAILDSLESGIRNMKWRGSKTVWTDYYSDKKCVSYEDKSLAAKADIVSELLDKTETKTLWDMGANTGMFSRVAAKKNIFVVSMDYDPTVVEQNYRQVKRDQEKNILPLVIDLVNPTPAVGWHNEERESIFSRPKPDTLLALALVHHLAIGKNLPFSKIAGSFSDTSRTLIIEFVPKEDKQTRLLLHNRTDIFPGYTMDDFEQEFSRYYDIKEKISIPDSIRYLYLMRRKEK